MLRECPPIQLVCQRLPARLDIPGRQVIWVSNPRKFLHGLALVSSRRLRPNLKQSITAPQPRWQKATKKPDRAKGIWRTRHHGRLSKPPTPTNGRSASSLA